MIYSIQVYLENYFHRCGLTDPDQYAVSLARLYERHRDRKTAPAFLTAMRRLRTVFYKHNERTQRAPFERKLLILLDAKFKKKEFCSSRRHSLRGLKLRAVG
jgi:hypothetical protein